MHFSLVFYNYNLQKVAAPCITDKGKRVAQMSFGTQCSTFKQKNAQRYMILTFLDTTSSAPHSLSGQIRPCLGALRTAASFIVLYLPAVTVWLVLFHIVSLCVCNCGKIWCFLLQQEVLFWHLFVCLHAVAWCPYSSHQNEGRVR